MPDDPNDQPVKRDDTVSVGFPLFLEVNPRLLSGAAVMLIVGALLIIYASTFFKSDSSIWFIAYILIALTALAMTAAVFRGLGFRANESEAFGLPAGSIRAVIAIAIMVLLLIFGLPYVSNDPGTKVVNRTALGGQVLVSCDRAEAEVKRYEAVGLIPVLDTRACQSGAPVGATASITIYGQSRQSAPVNQDKLVTSRQLVTAMITLLTTIIGFYFGSQQALNLFTALNERNSGGSAQGESKNPDPDPGKSPSDGKTGTTPIGTEDEGKDGNTSGAESTLLATGAAPGEAASSAKPQGDQDEDCCPSDAEPVAGESVTTDEELPEAKGGVAAAEVVPTENLIAGVSTAATLAEKASDAGQKSAEA